MLAWIASSHTLFGHSIQSELLNTSLLCLIGSVETILLVSDLWITGHDKFPLLLEMYWAAVSGHMSTQKLGLIVMKSAGEWQKEKEYF